MLPSLRRRKGLRRRAGRLNERRLIPGFYDRVQPPSPKERGAWASLPFDEKEYTEKEMGARELLPVVVPRMPATKKEVWAATFPNSRLFKGKTLTVSVDQCTFG